MWKSKASCPLTTLSSQLVHHIWLSHASSISLCSTLLLSCNSCALSVVLSASLLWTHLLLTSTPEDSVRMAMPFGQGLMTANGGAGLIILSELAPYFVHLTMTAGCPDRRVLQDFSTYHSVIVAYSSYISHCCDKAADNRDVGKQGSSWLSAWECSPPCRTVVVRSVSGCGHKILRPLVTLWPQPGNRESPIAAQLTFPSPFHSACDHSYGMCHIHSAGLFPLWLT